MYICFIWRLVDTLYNNTGLKKYYSIWNKSAHKINYYLPKLPGVNNNKLLFRQYLRDIQVAWKFICFFPADEINAVV